MKKIKNTCPFYNIYDQLCTNKKFNKWVRCKKAKCKYINKQHICPFLWEWAINKEKFNREAKNA